MNSKNKNHNYSNKSDDMTPDFYPIPNPQTPLSIPEPSQKPTSPSPDTCPEYFPGASPEISEPISPTPEINILS